MAPGYHAAAGAGAGNGIQESEPGSAEQLLTGTSNGLKTEADRSAFYRSGIEKRSTMPFFSKRSE
jgi:hypothetical protein